MTAVGAQATSGTLTVATSHVGCRDCCRSASLQGRVATFEYSRTGDRSNLHHTDGTVHVVLASLPMSLAKHLAGRQRYRTFAVMYYPRSGEPDSA